MLDPDNNDRETRTMKLRCELLALIMLLVASTTGAQQPNDIVLWSARLRSERAIKPGEKIAGVLSASIEDGWHIYSLTQGPGGPIPTNISVPLKQIVSSDGNVSGPKPEESFDPNFLIVTEFYEHSVNFEVPLVVDPAAKSGPATAIIDVRFQTCSERLCLRPATIHVPLAVNTTRVGADKNTVLDFLFTDFTGKARKFSEFKGKVLLLDFWATWCKPCLADIPHLKELYAKHHAHGFEIIGMDSETLGQDAGDADPQFAKERQEQARQIVSTRVVNWTQATSDTAVPVAVKVFGVESLPTKILIDREGKIVARIKDSAELDQLLEKLFSGKQ